MPTKTLKLFSTVHLEKKNNAKAQILCLEKKRLMMALSSSLGVMDLSIIFCRGMIMDTEGDVSLLMSVVTFFRDLRILVRSFASFVSLSVKTAMSIFLVIHCHVLA